MSEVAATGMQCNIRWCAEDSNILEHTLRYYVYRRRQTLYFVLLYGFPKTSRSGQVELEAYV